MPAFVFLHCMNHGYQYIDIHTHDTATARPDVLRIQSIMAGNPTPANSASRFSLGIHPWQLDGNNHQTLWMELLQQMDAPQLCAIGETGLDRSIQTPMQLQMDVFEQHIQLAENRKLPLIIHAVRCMAELLQLRKKHPSGIWIVHGFTGNATQARQCMKLHIHLSFGKALLTASSKLREALMATAPGQLFFETDSAEVAIAEIYQAAANILQIEELLLCRQIETNFQHCFNIVQ